MDDLTAEMADPPARALSMLALISAELNSQMSLEGVTAAVLHAAVELNDASVAVVGNLDGSGSISVTSLERDEIPLAAGCPGIGHQDDRSHGALRMAEQMRSVVRPRDPITIDDLPRGVIASCLRSGEPSWLRRQTEETLLGKVDQAFAHPVRDEAGAVVAVLAVGWNTEVASGTDIRAVTELFCDLASSGLVRARRAEELSDLAKQLRTELLPATVTRDHLEVAFDYVPALNTLGFGGDWFDIVEPEPGRMVLVVGDIAGHGVHAAAQMALAQGAVRGLSQCSAIEAIPRLATRCLTETDKGMLATLALIDVDLRSDTIACQLAGHPPPMLRQRDGRVLRLGGTPLPPIGMVQTVDVPGDRTAFDQGDIVVLYSDGLIERRGADLSERLDQLERTIAELDVDVSAPEALETICNSMLTDDSEDDVAILVLKATR